jgi:2-phosphoglycerate kinase
MGSHGGEGQSAPRSPRGGRRILVEDASGRRPFMRGIMVHSLMARGVSFEDAYETANEVRRRIGGRQVVPKGEIAKSVREILGEEPFREDRRFPLPPNISVNADGHDAPFSKGILSQSLLAAALDPNDAFDVAREIERELLSRGLRQIGRRELRRQTYRTVARAIGEQTAERYLVWRRHQDGERPVIILLGGTAGVGKTSLALEVAHRLGIGRVLSTDSIRQIMRLVLSRELLPALHGSSYDAYRLLGREALGDDPVIDGFRAQTTTVAVGLRASMDRAVAENASTVLDGVSIVPGLVDLGAYAEIAHVVFLVVACLDEGAFAKRFEARALGQKRRGKHRYLENLDAILKIQDYFLDIAERYDVPIVDNVSFDRSVLFIIRHVTETLRKRGGFEAADML